MIRAENIGKKYTIGHQQDSNKMLREVIADGAKAIKQTLLRSNLKPQAGMAYEDFWALNDVSFTIQQGEVVGIIGSNGAGKSTLLKVLSRITEPTKGRITLNGRVSSLLEVGTGFHPELSGRENIFLNGAVLGMSKVEIQRKFDEIVAFAEVEKFLDTPVKRYSSGMYVRLAFAVAAHLEPEILIVDEVLAVGDAAFQKKCLGKMGEVAQNQGRTVLFVSHNMQAVSQLTKRCIMLAKGNVIFDGATEQGIKTYLSMQKESSERAGYYEAPKSKSGNYVQWAKVNTSEEEGVHGWGQPITFEFALCIQEPQDSLCFSFQVLNELEQPTIISWLFDGQAPYQKKAGLFLLRCHMPKFRLYMGSYTVRTWLSDRRSNHRWESLSSICSFDVSMHGVEREEYNWQPDECTYLEDSIWETIPQEVLV
jgi:ABC-type polysaccharide/polyol phosphate transport system ATPase subunit